MPSKKEVSFPYVVSKGSVTVRIYHTPSHGCDSYTLSYYRDGVRKRPTFSTFKAAKREAEMVSQRLGRADADVLLLKSADRASYLRARELLDPLGMELETAAAQIAGLHKRLNGVPLSTAVEFYVKRHPAKLDHRMVSAVVDELISTKEKDGLSERYVKALRWSLGKFAKRFHCHINVVPGTEIDRWLRDSGLAPRTRNNLRNAVQTLFGFAKARGYVPKDHDELDAVSIMKDGDGDIEVFTPEEMREILV